MENNPMSNRDYENVLLFVRNWFVSNLEGRILTLIESMGLKEKQEEAVKSFARKEIWSWKEELIEVPRDVEKYWEEKHCCNQTPPIPSAI